MFNQLFGKHYQQPRPHRNRTRTCARQLSQQKPHCWNCPLCDRSSPPKTRKGAGPLIQRSKCLANSDIRIRVCWVWMLYLKLRLLWAGRCFCRCGHGWLHSAFNWAKPPRQTQHSTFGTTQSKAQKGMQYRDRRGNNSQSNLLVAV
jgi:hypothetical protein